MACAIECRPRGRVKAADSDPLPRSSLLNLNGGGFVGGLAGMRVEGGERQPVDRGELDHKAINRRI